MEHRYCLRIKDLPESERPRERLLEHGCRSLSDAELLGLILRTGNGKESAVVLAQRLLKETGSLQQLAGMGPEELSGKFSGIGPAKAAEIAAVFELGRRTGNVVPPQSEPVTDSAVAYQLLKPHLEHLAQEELWALLVNARGKYLACRRITRGGHNHTVVEPMDVFRPAINLRAAAIILAHNHPDGDPTPSPDDIHMTHRLVAAGATLNVQVLDHLVITDHGFTSFLDGNLLPNNRPPAGDSGQSSQPDVDNP